MLASTSTLTASGAIWEGVSILRCAFHLWKNFFQRFRHQFKGSDATWRVVAGRFWQFIFETSSLLLISLDSDIAAFKKKIIDHIESQNAAVEILNDKKVEKLKVDASSRKKKKLSEKENKTPLATIKDNQLPLAVNQLPLTKVIEVQAGAFENPAVTLLRASNSKAKEKRDNQAKLDKANLDEVFAMGHQWIGLRRAEVNTLGKSATAAVEGVFGTIKNPTAVGISKRCTANQLCQMCDAYVNTNEIQSGIDAINAARIRKKRLDNEIAPSGRKKGKASPGQAFTYIEANIEGSNITAYAKSLLIDEVRDITWLSARRHSGSITLGKVALVS